LRRIGILLLAFAAIHIVFSIASSLNGTPSYSLDIVSLILGLLLLNGSVGAARWLAFLTASQVVTWPLFLVGVPLAIRGTLMSQLFESMGFGIANYAAMTAIELAIAIWILWQLRRPEVDDLMAAAGKTPSWRPMVWGAGIALPLMAASLLALAPMARTFDRLMSQAAIVQARQQLGSSYQYSLASIRWDAHGGWHAQVIAVDDKETRVVEVGSRTLR
jgi:hypothetical protein